MSEACFVYDSLVLEPACTGWFIVFFIFCCQFLLLLLFIRRRRIFPLAERAVPMTIGCLSQVLFLAEFLTQSKIYPCGVLVVGYLLQSQILLVPASERLLSFRSPLIVFVISMSAYLFRLLYDYVPSFLARDLFRRETVQASRPACDDFAQMVISFRSRTNQSIFCTTSLSICFPGKTLHESLYIMNNFTVS